MGRNENVNDANPIIVFVNSLSRSRTTLTDNLLNEIYNQNNAYNPCSEKSKKMLKDVGNVKLFELLKRNAKSAYCVGVKASSIAPAGIS